MTDWLWEAEKRWKMRKKGKGEQSRKARRSEIRTPEQEEQKGKMRKWMKGKDWTCLFMLYSIRRKTRQQQEGEEERWKWEMCLWGFGGGSSRSDVVCLRVSLSYMQNQKANHLHHLHHSSGKTRREGMKEKARHKEDMRGWKRERSLNPHPAKISHQLKPVRIGERKEIRFKLRDSRNARHSFPSLL